MRYGYDMKTAARTTVNILAVDVFRRVVAMAPALGIDEGDRYRSRATALVDAIRRRLTRPDGVLVDGLEPDGTQSHHASQLANALALEYGIVPASQVRAVTDHVVSLGNAVGVPTFSDLLVALHDGGRDDAFVRALSDPSRPGYAQILREGATFTWESWDARQTGDSESHGWGAAVIPVLVEDVLGVTVTSPGAATVDVHVPALDAVSANGVVASQRGPIAVAWDARSSSRSLELTVPANMTATVHLPTTLYGVVRESGHALTGDRGVTSVRPTGTDTIVTIGSGHYVFTNIVGSVE